MTTNPQTPDKANAKVRQVDYPGASQHSSYYLFRVDLTIALKNVRLMIEKDLDSTILQPLFSSAVIAYSRCFISGSGSKLNANDIFKGNPRNPMVFHEVIIGMRHRVYAHRDSEVESAHYGPIVTDDRPAKIIGYGNFSGLFAAFQDHDMKQFHDLIRTVLSYLSEKINSLEKRMREYCENLTEEELASLPVAKFTTSNISKSVRKDNQKKN